MGVDMSYLAKAQAVRREWNDADAEAAFAATLHRIRDVVGTPDVQRSADLWEALNAAWFACDRAAFDVALAELETHVLTATPVTRHG